MRNEIVYKAHIAIDDRHGRAYGFSLIRRTNVIIIYIYINCPNNHTLLVKNRNVECVNLALINGSCRKAHCESVQEHGSEKLI